MIKGLQRHAATIVIGVAFYVSGFFAIANLLPLSSRDSGLGLTVSALTRPARASPCGPGR